jgi:hypothetical protein
MALSDIGDRPANPGDKEENTAEPAQAGAFDPRLQMALIGVGLVGCFTCMF